MEKTGQPAGLHEGVDSTLEILDDGTEGWAQALCAVAFVAVFIISYLARRRTRDAAAEAKLEFIKVGEGKKTDETPSAPKPAKAKLAEPKKESKPSMSQMDLARILGNSVPDDEGLASSTYHPPRSEIIADWEGVGPESGVGETLRDLCGDVQANSEQREVGQGRPGMWIGGAARDAGEALIKAMAGEDGELATRLVNAGSTAVINYLDADERNALIVGAMEGHSEACQALLSRADFIHANKTNHVGATALHLAAANDHIPICTVLIDSPNYTAGINAKTRNGQTPLDFALDFGEGTCGHVIESAGGERTNAGSLRARRKMRGHAAAEGEDEGETTEYGACDAAEQPGKEMASLD